MYLLKGTKYFIAIFLVLSFLVPQQAVSQHCPDCTAQQNSLQQAQNQLQSAKDAVENAKKNVNDAADDLKTAMKIAAAAGLAMTGSCASIPVTTFVGAILCAAAAAAFYLAMDDVASKTKKLSDAKKSLFNAQQQANAAQKQVDAAREALQECQNQAVGNLPKCINLPKTVCYYYTCQDGSCNTTIMHNNGAPCNDNNKCTKNDRCDGGQCKGTPITSKEDPDCP